MFIKGESIQPAIPCRFCNWHMPVEPITSLLGLQVVSTREIFRLGESRNAHEQEWDEAKQSWVGLR